MRYVQKPEPARLSAVRGRPGKTHIRQRAWQEAPQNKTKKARRPEGRRAKHGKPEFACALVREKSRQRSAGFDWCDHPEGAGLGKGGNARVVIAELLAQDLPRVLAKQRRRNGIDDWRQAKVER